MWRELIGDSAEQSVILFLHILLAFLGHSSRVERLSCKYALLHSHSSHPSPPFRLFSRFMSALAFAAVSTVNKDAWLTMHLLIAWLFFLTFIRPFPRLHVWAHATSSSKRWSKIWLLWNISLRKRYNLHKWGKGTPWGMKEKKKNTPKKDKETASQRQKHALHLNSQLWFKRAKGNFIHNVDFLAQCPQLSPHRWVFYSLFFRSEN